MTKYPLVVVKARRDEWYDGPEAVQIMMIGTPTLGYRFSGIRLTDPAFRRLVRGDEKDIQWLRELLLCVAPDGDPSEALEVFKYVEVST